MNLIEYKQFAESIALANEIVDMRLQLNMCLTEVFFGGVFANAAISQDVAFDDLGAFLASASTSVLETIASGTIGSMPSSSSPMKASAVAQRSKAKTQPAVTCRLNYSCLVCVYCDTPGNIEHLNIKVHPYVPVTMDRKVLYLCEPCLNNWHSYRQEASRLRLLVLPGEYNEEVCCVCSDSPSQLVLCSSCPRSYCAPCLSKLLTQKQSADMITNEHWRCLCCAHSDQAFRGFTSALNLTIASQKCPLPLGLSDPTPASTGNSNNNSTVMVTAATVTAQF
jgi:hypothetical protein